jgi:hypothetical protein
VWRSVYTLALFAQRGIYLGESVESCCLALVPACKLLSDNPLNEELDVDTMSDLGLVISAALCRQSLRKGEAVTLPRLAHFAGLTPGRLRQMVDAGEIKASKGRRDRTISARNAVAWLSARGVVV